MFSPASSRGGGGGSITHAAARQPTLVYMLGLLLVLSLTAWWWSSTSGSSGAGGQNEANRAQQREYLASTRPRKGGAGAQAIARARLASSSLATKTASAAAAAGSEDSSEVTTTCTWQFSHYTPSSWETEWSIGIFDVQDTKGAICAKLAQKPQQALAMIAQIEDWHSAEAQTQTASTTTPSYATINNNAPTTTATPATTTTSAASMNKARRPVAEGTPGTDLMSRMHYKLVCSSGEELARGFQLIEPLVGLLRDPLCLCPPLPGQGPDPLGHDQVHSKRFLLPMAYAPFQVEVAPNAPRDLSSAIEQVVKGSGLSPWAYHGPRTTTTAATTATATTTAAPITTTTATAATAKGSTGAIATKSAVTATATLTAATTAAATPAGPWRFYSKPASNPAEETRETALRVVSPSGTTGSERSVVVPPNLLLQLDPDLRSRGAPRILLFDMGASYFGFWENPGQAGKAEGAQGSSHFYTAMKNRGLRFDHVWAYEYEVLDPRKEWASIPADLYADFTFVNSGVLGDPASHANPWNTLLQQARPSDYVIVKLDIDTPEIELALMQQLLDEPALQDRIDELYFEHHVLVPDMFLYWGKDPVKLPQKLNDSYEMFTKLRQLGVRMHSWP